MSYLLLFFGAQWLILNGKPVSICFEGCRVTEQVFKCKQIMNKDLPELVTCVEQQQGPLIVDIRKHELRCTCEFLNFAESLRKEEGYVVFHDTICSSIVITKCGINPVTKLRSIQGKPVYAVFGGRVFDVTAFDFENQLSKMDREQRKIIKSLKSLKVKKKYELHRENVIERAVLDADSLSEQAGVSMLDAVEDDPEEKYEHNTDEESYTMLEKEIFFFICFHAAVMTLLIALLISKSHQNRVAAKYIEEINKKLQGAGQFSSEPKHEYYQREPSVEEDSIREDSIHESGMHEDNRRESAMHPGSMYEDNRCETADHPGSRRESAMYPGSMHEGSRRESAMYPSSMHEGSRRESAMYPGGMHEGSRRESAMHPGSMYDGSRRESAMHEGSRRESSMYPGSMYEGNRRESAMHEGSRRESAMHEGNRRESAMHEGNRRESAMHPGGTHDKTVMCVQEMQLGMPGKKEDFLQDFMKLKKQTVTPCYNLPDGKESLLDEKFMKLPDTRNLNYEFGVHNVYQVQHETQGMPQKSKSMIHEIQRKPHETQSLPVEKIQSAPCRTQSMPHNAQCVSHKSENFDRESQILDLRKSKLPMQRTQKQTQEADTLLQELDVKKYSSAESNALSQESDVSYKQAERNWKEYNTQFQAFSVNQHDPDTKQQELNIKQHEPNMKIQDSDTVQLESNIRPYKSDTKAYQIKLRGSNTKLSETDVKLKKSFTKLLASEVRHPGSNTKEEESNITQKESNIKQHESDPKSKELKTKHSKTNVQEGNAKLFEPNIKLFDPDVRLQQLNVIMQEPHLKLQKVGLKLRESKVGKTKPNEFRLEDADVKPMESSTDVRADDSSTSVEGLKLMELQSELTKIQQQLKNRFDIMAHGEIQPIDEPIPERKKRLRSARPTKSSQTDLKKPRLEEELDTMWGPIQVTPGSNFRLKKPSRISFTYLNDMDIDDLYAESNNYLKTASEDTDQQESGLPKTRKVSWLQLTPNSSWEQAPNQIKAFVLEPKDNELVHVDNFPDPYHMAGAYSYAYPFTNERTATGAKSGLQHRKAERRRKEKAKRNKTHMCVYHAKSDTEETVESQSEGDPRVDSQSEEQAEGAEYKLARPKSSKMVQFVFLGQTDSEMEGRTGTEESECEYQEKCEKYLKQMESEMKDQIRHTKSDTSKTVSWAEQKNREAAVKEMCISEPLGSVSHSDSSPVNVDRKYSRTAKSRPEVDSNRGRDQGNISDGPKVDVLKFVVVDDPASEQQTDAEKKRGEENDPALDSKFMKARSGRYKLVSCISPRSKKHGERSDVVSEHKKPETHSQEKPDEMTKMKPTLADYQKADDGSRILDRNYRKKDVQFESTESELGSKDNTASKLKKFHLKTCASPCKASKSETKPSVKHSDRGASYLDTQPQGVTEPLKSSEVQELAGSKQHDPVESKAEQQQCRSRILTEQDEQKQFKTDMLIERRELLGSLFDDMLDSQQKHEQWLKETESHQLSEKKKLTEPLMDEFQKKKTGEFEVRKSRDLLMGEFENKISFDSLKDDSDKKKSHDQPKGDFEEKKSFDPPKSELEKKKSADPQKNEFEKKSFDPEKSEVENKSFDPLVGKFQNKKPLDSLKDDSEMKKYLDPPKGEFEEKKSHDPPKGGFENKKSTDLLIDGFEDFSPASEDQVYGKRNRKEGGAKFQGWGMFIHHSDDEESRVKAGREANTNRGSDRSLRFTLLDEPEVELVYKKSDDKEFKIERDDGEQVPKTDLYAELEAKYENKTIVRPPKINLDKYLSAPIPSEWAKMKLESGDQGDKKSLQVYFLHEAGVDSVPKEIDRSMNQHQSVQEGTLLGSHLQEGDGQAQNSSENRVSGFSYLQEPHIELVHKLLDKYQNEPDVQLEERRRDMFPDHQQSMKAGRAPVSWQDVEQMSPLSQQYVEWLSPVSQQFTEQMSPVSQQDTEQFSPVSQQDVDSGHSPTYRQHNKLRSPHKKKNLRILSTFQKSSTVETSPISQECMKRDQSPSKNKEKSPTSQKSTKQEGSPTSKKSVKLKLSPTSWKSKKQEGSPTSKKSLKLKLSPTSWKSKKQEGSPTSKKSVKLELSPTSKKGKKQEGAPTSEKSKKQESSPTSKKSVKLELSPTSQKSTKRERSPASKKMSSPSTSEAKKRSPVKKMQPQVELLAESSSRIEQSRNIQAYFIASDPQDDDHWRRSHSEWQGRDANTFCLPSQPHEMDQDVKKYFLQSSPEVDKAEHAVDNEWQGRDAKSFSFETLSRQRAKESGNLSHNSVPSQHCREIETVFLQSPSEREVKASVSSEHHGDGQWQNKDSRPFYNQSQAEQRSSRMVDVIDYKSITGQHRYSSRREYLDKSENYRQNSLTEVNKDESGDSPSELIADDPRECRLEGDLGCREAGDGCHHESSKTAEKDQPSKLDKKPTRQDTFEKEGERIAETEYESSVSLLSSRDSSPVTGVWRSAFRRVLQSDSSPLIKGKKSLQTKSEHEDLVSGSSSEKSLSLGSKIFSKYHRTKHISDNLNKSFDSSNQSDDLDSNQIG